MAFEKFRGGKSKVNPDNLFITTSGSISIGTNLAEVSGIKEGDSVVLLWDKSRNKIAIAPIREYEVGAYKVGMNKGGSAPHIHGTSFLKHIGLDLKRLKDMGQDIKATWNDEEGQIETEPMKGF